MNPTSAQPHSGNSAKDTKFEFNHKETSDRHELEDSFQSNWFVVRETSRPQGTGAVSQAEGD